MMRGLIVLAMLQSTELPTVSSKNVPLNIESEEHYLNEDILITQQMHIAFRIVIYTLYGLIAVTGVTGNTLVLFVVLRKPAMRTITNIFITNLSVSDILMGIIATVFTPVTADNHNLKINEGICKLLPMTMGISVYVSTLTCTAIAADRFFVIVHPFMPRMKLWLCGMIILIIWMVAILISMPHGVYRNGHKLDNNVTYCYEDWPKHTGSMEVFTVLTFILQYVIPGSIIAYCYFRISLILRIRYKKKLTSTTSNPFREEREINRKRRTNSMLIAMVIIFFVCWIPLNLHWLINDFGFRNTKKSLDTKVKIKVTFYICHLIAMSSAVYNPFLYAWMNENFRKEFRSILPCIFSNPGASSARHCQAAYPVIESTMIRQQNRSNVIILSEDNPPINEKEDENEKSIESFSQHSKDKIEESNP